MANLLPTKGNLIAAKRSRMRMLRLRSISS